MASRGKKDKGNAVAAAPEVPPEREAIPGKITESQWLEWVRGEESSEVAGEVVRGLVDLAFSLGQDHHLQEQAFSHAVQTAKASLLQIIEWEFLQRDEGERDPGNDPSWQEDNEPECSVVDSWARGIVPEVSNLPEEDTPTFDLEDPTQPDTLPDTEVPPPYDRETSTANSILPRDNSRHTTRASTVGSSSTFTISSRPPPTRNPPALKVTRPRPQARRPQARLIALARPQSVEAPVTCPSPDLSHQAPSPAHSHTPTTSPAPPSPSSPLPPPPLPYNMKPAQLRWQKDVTYDSSGKIVDLLRLDPASFPTHRVRPRVTISGPGHVPSRRPARSSQHQSSPLSLPHNPSSPGKLTKSTNTGTGREGGGKRSVRVEGVRKRGDGKGKEVSRGSGPQTTARETSSRFPEILTLPALVDTIDLSAGMCVREGNRSVCGPPSPHRPPHFLLPHTSMLPVTLPPSLSPPLSTTADTG